MAPWTLPVVETVVAEILRTLVYKYKQIKEDVDKTDSWTPEIHFYSLWGTGIYILNPPP